MVTITPIFVGKKHQRCSWVGTKPLQTLRSPGALPACSTCQGLDIQVFFYPGTQLSSHPFTRTSPSASWKPTSPSQPLPRQAPGGTVGAGGLCTGGRGPRKGKAGTCVFV